MLAISASKDWFRDLLKFESLFFNSRFYDLTEVGRVRMNSKLGLSVPKDVTILTKEDIVETIRYLVNLKERGEGVLDDIDHFGNTTAATIPLCLFEWEKRLTKGDNLILSAFGGGFTWGAIYLKWAY